jgi:hypothetical protein
MFDVWQRHISYYRAPSTCHVHLAPPSPHAYLNGLEHVIVRKDVINALVLAE